MSAHPDRRLQKQELCRPIDSNQAPVQCCIVECWDQGNVELLSELCAPTYLPYFSDRATGLPEVKQWITGLDRAFPEFRPRIDDEICAWDNIIIRPTMRGSQQRPLLVLAPTRCQMEYTGIDIIRCKDGRITEFWGRPDSAVLQRQLGRVRP